MFVLTLSRWDTPAAVIAVPFLVYSKIYGAVPLVPLKVNWGLASSLHTCMLGDGAFNDATGKECTLMLTADESGLLQVVVPTVYATERRV